MRDCPTNNDKNLDPSKSKGIPRTQLWRVAIANPELFKTTMPKTMQSLVKQSNLYLPESQLEAESTPELRQANPEKFPPSLLCQLCKCLLDEATLTPCCHLSCCFKCIFSQMTK